MSSSRSEEATPGGTEISQAKPGSAKMDTATDLLSRIWQQHLPLMRERVATLRQAGSESRLGPLGAERRTEASDLAHKLAGSLGMFGYPRGTEIAREIEHLLEQEAPLDGEHLFRLTEALCQLLPLGG